MILKAVQTPYVLRLRRDGGYTLVGECYVYGVMDEEAASEDWQGIRII